MKRKIELILSLILAGGVLFSWFTVINDFIRFNRIYGTIFRLINCSVPNPIATPCFYGAIGFIIAFYLSLKLKINQLWYLLVGGTIFAWSNFGYEAYKFYSSTGVKTSCSGIVTNNIFTTPCFYGSVIYLISLFTLYIYRKTK